jgi:hypothetical protein
VHDPDDKETKLILPPDGKKELTTNNPSYEGMNDK